MLDAIPPAGPTINTDSDAILTFLTTRQHLRPHDSVQGVLSLTVGEFDCCPRAIIRALQWLNLDGASAIGRLRRSELVQLARVIHRFWSQSAAETSPASR